MKIFTRIKLFFKKALATLTPIKGSEKLEELYTQQKKIIAISRR